MRAEGRREGGDRWAVKSGCGAANIAYALLCGDGCYIVDMIARDDGRELGFNYTLATVYEFHNLKRVLYKYYYLNIYKTPEYLFLL